MSFSANVLIVLNNSFSTLMIIIEWGKIHFLASFFYFYKIAFEHLNVTFSEYKIWLIKEKDKIKKKNLNI